MNVNSYCDNLNRHLTEWKAKIYDVIRVIDKLPVVENETVFPSVRSLHSIVEQINGQLEQLRIACPADWSPNRETIDEKMSELQSTLKTMSQRIQIRGLFARPE